MALVAKAWIKQSSESKDLLAVWGTHSGEGDVTEMRRLRLPC